MKLSRSLTFQLAIQYASIIFLFILIILSAHYYLNVIRPTDAAKTALRNELNELVHIYHSEGIAELAKSLDARHSVAAERFPFQALTDSQGRVITSNLPSWPLQDGSDWLRIEADLHTGGQEKDREALVLDHRMADGTRLLLGRNIEDLDDLEEDVEIAALVLLLLTTAVVIISGAITGLSVGRRIEALDTAARQIMATTLSTRIPLAGKNDDLDRLAETLNEMLARLEAAVASLRRTSDSVAHELRTPLARLQSLIESMLRESHPSKDSLAQALKEIEGLGRLFDSVLAITRLESEYGHPDMRSVSLTEILADAVEFYEGISHEQNLRFSSDIQPDLRVQGNADLLFQAACNLLENAMKYTPPGGAVSLAAQATNNEILVEITDTGPGIPDELHELVTQPFYRAPSTASIPGNGLGLALVAAVNTVHNATIKFQRRADEFCVEWRIPLK